MILITNMPSSYVRLDKKTKDKFKKICDKQSFSEQLVLEKYVQRVIKEGYINTGEWI